MYFYGLNYSMKKKNGLLFLCLMLVSISIYAASVNRSDTIDIRKTIIHLNITDFTSKIISAKSSLDIKSKQNGITSLLFDLEGLTADSVMINGSAAFYNHVSPLLTVYCPLMNLNDSAIVDVYYHGIPIQDATWGGFSFVGNYGFQIGVGFNAQPHSFGRTWHPCFDNFVERSAYEFYVTTTDDKMAVCNGLLIDSTVNTNNTKTWHWKLDEEIPSYLSCVTVSKYVVVKQILSGNNGNIDALIVCEPAYIANVNASFAHLQQSFSMLEQHFGTYQWPRVGYSLIPFNAGAMEHATNISIGIPFVDGTLNYETLIAHELSHHWWGDLVTCRTAGDMWLNEGFASYCERLHTQYMYGQDAYIAAVRDNHFNVLKTAHIKDDGYRAIANMDSLHTYGATVYTKGADAIHTLRTYLGDSLFFNALTAFLNTNKSKDISSSQLRDFLTTYTGKDMTNYFQNWIFSPGFTHFSIDSSQVTSVGNQYLNKVFLRQRKHHSADYYSDVPLEVGFYDSMMNRQVYQVNFNGRCMELDVTLPFVPAMIIVDPDSKISDAITEEWRMVKATGTLNLTQAKCKVYVKSVNNPNDSTWLRIEHNWVAADRFKTISAADSYVLCDTRYWKVDGIHLNNITGLIQFPYDANANNNFLDSTWLKNTEDSIRLFYRKDATQEWTFANDSIVAGSLTNKNGNMYCKEIKAGEYCLGIKRSNYIDTIITDAPLGGCGVVTTLENPSKQNLQKILILPNPATKDVQIVFADDKSKNVQINLINIEGKLLFTSHKNDVKQQMNLVLSRLAKGMYLIIIQDKNTKKEWQEKLMIE